MDQQYLERKQKVFDLIGDRHYVPMKLKEIAILMSVEKEERAQLEQILEELQQEAGL